MISSAQTTPDGIVDRRGGISQDDAGLQSFAYPKPRIRPIRALRAMRRLIANPQDTAQVAALEIAVGGCSPERIFNRFAASAHGRHVLVTGSSLVKTLSDHTRLGSLPEGSVGREYLNFINKSGLSAQGLMEKTAAYTEYLANLPEQVRIFSDHTQRGAHDLFHVLGGYGQDELGEACVIGMAYEQLRIRGYWLIATIGPFVIRRHFRRAGIDPAGVHSAVREARLRGRQAAWIPGIDLEALLPEPLTDVQARLNLAFPAIYNAMLPRARAASN